MSHWRSLIGDLRLGAGLSSRGRESLTRTVLMALGVGAATAALLLASSLPTILDDRGERAAARMDYQVAEYPTIPPGDDTLSFLIADTDYRGTPVFGRIIRPEGPDAPVPPGVTELPGPGEMVVSPALADLLDDPDAEVLQRRFDHPVVGEIAPEGLDGPRELAFYLHDGALEGYEAENRITRYGGVPGPGGDEPLLLLLGVVGTVVMLTPVVVFLAAAVRFGGEQRDRRLAALRLMGADRAATRRIAAGETLPGTALGLLVGVVLFLAARPVAEAVPVAEGVFAADVVPHPVLGGLVFLVVPLLALWVVLTSLRTVAVEPLGVVRRADRGRPRVGWRLLLLAVGATLIAGSMRLGLTGGMWAPMVAFGILAVLLGTTAILPWLVDRAFGRAGGGGPLALQMAVRRLGAAGGGPTRAVNGIVVTVAGAIALQALFTGAEAQMEGELEQTVERVYEGNTFGEHGYNLAADLPLRPAEEGSAPALEEAPGVAEALVFTRMWGTASDGTSLSVFVAGCPTLARIADLPECAPGDVFSADPDLAVGDELVLERAGEGAVWRVPEYTWTPATVTLPEGDGADPARVVLATPEADATAAVTWGATAWLRVDPAVPDVQEEVRAALAGLDPAFDANFSVTTRTGSGLDGMRNMLLAGAVACLAMIAAGLVVGTVEQVRASTRVHAVLTAFGTPRRTLAGSLVWQTALPVLLGTALATVAGLVLGALLMALGGVPIAFAPADVLVVSGAGAGAVLLATLLALPALLRTTRPQGLRWE